MGKECRNLELLKMVLKRTEHKFLCEDPFSLSETRRPSGALLPKVLASTDRCLASARAGKVVPPVRYRSPEFFSLLKDHCRRNSQFRMRIPEQCLYPSEPRRISLSEAGSVLPAGCSAYAPMLPLRQLQRPVHNTVSVPPPSVSSR